MKVSPFQGVHIEGFHLCRQSEAVDLEPESWELVVKCEGESVPVMCKWVEGGLEVRVEGEVVTITTDWSLGQPMMLAHIDGKEVAIQVRGNSSVLPFLRYNVV